MHRLFALWIFAAPAFAQSLDESDGDFVWSLWGESAPQEEPPPGPLLPPEEPAAAPRFTAETYLGADQLGLAPEYVHEVQIGLGLLLDRRYDDGVAHLGRVDRRFPGTAIGAVGLALSWQARMLEHADGRHDAAYREASARARSELRTALEDPSHQGWDHFLTATVYGLEALHAALVQGYLPALPLAVEAMAHVGKAKEASPGFTDLLLVDGLYHYWRATLGDDTGDHRAQGLAEMREVEGSGVFLASAATLALAHAYLQEGDTAGAAAACARFASRHPANTLNNLLLGQVQTQRGQYEDALATYDGVLRADPSNDRVHYLRGLTLLKAGSSGPAISELEAYLSSPYLDDDRRAASHYRLGQAHHKRKEYAAAAAHYQKAVELAGHEAAGDALSRMEGARAAGRIEY